LAGFTKNAAGLCTMMIKAFFQGERQFFVLMKGVSLAISAFGRLDRPACGKFRR
jgi:hypothetical protein